MSGAATNEGPGNHDLLNQTLVGLLRACDMVFGSATMILAALVTWLYATGRASLPAMAAMWAVPVLNTAWSRVTIGRDRMKSDLIRGAACLPITTYVYAAEAGVLELLWIPALVMAVGISMSVGIATRRPHLGYVVTLVYGVALTVAHPDLNAVSDAAGVVVTGFVIALVGSRLGRTLDEARRQRDDAQRQQARAEAALRQIMTMEIELRQAQKLESVGRLAAGVAHEINTPVQFVSDSIHFLRDANRDVMTVVELLRAVRGSVLDGAPSRAAAEAAVVAEAAADLPYLVENVPQAFDRSLDGLDRVATIVRALKEFAHPDARDMAAVDLNQAITSTLAIARHEYKLVADVETDLGELPPVTCHAGEINQAVLNIVVNAAHAIGDVVAGSDRKGRIAVSTRRDGDHVDIKIADTGGGIPDTIRDRVFDPFFTTKSVGRGTGQGLAVARSVIADKHHGELRFETAAGIGTTFFIRLPIDGQAGQSGIDSRARSSATS